MRSTIRRPGPLYRLAAVWLRRRGYIVEPPHYLGLIISGPVIGELVSTDPLRVNVYGPARVKLQLGARMGAVYMPEMKETPDA